MALTITVTDKATQAVTTVPGQEVSLSTPSVVKLPIPHDQIKLLAREGNDLVLTVTNGQTVVVHGFFIDDQTGPADQPSPTDHNDLVLQDGNGVLWLTDWSDLSALPVDTSLDPATAAGGAGAFSQIDSINPLLGNVSVATATDTDAAATAAGGTPSWLPVAYALAGFATALATAGHGGSSAAPVPQPPKELDITANPDGTITASGGAGSADPGDTVTVVFPDQSSNAATANGDGSYSVQSKTVQTSGTVEATATDAGGHVSQPASASYQDTTAPLAPQISNVSDNANGTLNVTGTAEALSTVTVYFNDGTHATGQAGADGQFTVSSSGPESSQTLTVTATDAAGNASDQATYDYTQPSAVSISAIAVDTTGPVGDNTSDFVTYANGSTDHPLTISGTVGPALTAYGVLEVSTDGGQTWIQVPSTDIDSSGNWSYTLTSSLPDGSYQLEAQVVNAADYAVVTAQAAQPLVIDTVAPTETVTVTGVTGGTQTDSGYNTTSATPTLSGQIDGPLADGSGSAQGVTAEALLISLDGGTNWQAVDVDNTALTWSYTPTTALTSGTSYNVQLEVVDLAGNVESQPTDSFVLQFVSVPELPTSTLTQPTSDADNQIYYAGDNPTGSALMSNGVDVIATGAGNNDWVHGIGTDTTGTTDLTVQHDTVTGGAGNDYIGIVSTNFSSIDGGAGWDTLVFEKSGLTVDLTQLGSQLQGFEQFDLNNQSNTASTDPRNQFTGLTTGNTLALHLSDILSQASSGELSTTNHMTILGDSSSTVQLDGTSDAASLAADGWTTTSEQLVNGVAFDVWHNASEGNNTVADLLIQHGVQVI